MHGDKEKNLPKKQVTQIICENFFFHLFETKLDCL